MGEVEAWDYLAAYQALRAHGADEVAAVKAACAQNHPQHKHVVQCRDCYPRIIGHIRSAYLDPKDGQWFSGRDAFLGDLDALFAAALQHHAKLDDVDARIDAEKRDWYVEQVRASPSISKALEDLLDRKDLVAKVGSKDVALEVLVEDMRAALHGGAEPRAAQEALGRLTAVKAPEERLQAYKEVFFQGRPGEPTPEKTQEKTQLYFEKLQAGATIREVVNKVGSDAAASISVPDQKEKHQKRIEELQRAKAAYELQKSKKVTKKPQPPEKTYEVPPCSVCRKEVDKEDFIGCPYCTILLDAGIRPKTTVWCSQACSEHDQGFDAHADEHHKCAGGDNCVQLVEEDVEMDLGNADDFLCRECTDKLKVESLFCSIRCAELNFQRHREGVHIPRREAEADRDADDLVFDEANKSRYHARDIRPHMAAVGELMKDLKQRNGMNP